MSNSYKSWTLEQENGIWGTADSFRNWISLSVAGTHGLSLCPTVGTWQFVVFAVYHFALLFYRWWHPCLNPLSISVSSPPRLYFSHETNAFEKQHIGLWQFTFIEAFGDNKTEIATFHRTHNLMIQGLFEANTEGKDKESLCLSWSLLATVQLSGPSAFEQQKEFVNSLL